MVGLMGLTASGLAARMRRSARRRLAEARTTYSCAGVLEKFQDLRSTMPSDQARWVPRAGAWCWVTEWLGCQGLVGTR